ncbi:unnamed protein product [Brachionus calyciflorus]|uniref:Tudor domain-containing protein n=1 Tax=Brachionus calyciflorus TaxID=104777 RepID=A0A814DP97_9BILA|nr:unnamed protein product [Brachionus calyciflorus]
MDIQKKVQELTIEDIQKPIPVQTKQLVEEIQEPVIEKVTSDYEKLEVNKTYNVNLQYYDENMQDVPFYVCLTDKFSKLEQLDVELQKQSNDKLKFKYVENLSELKLNDKLEALYESDSKWYRVEIRQLDIKRANLEIYFLDYGNSEKLDQMKPKSLRFRQKYDSQEEKDLFKLEYQAIKCCYKSQEEDSLSLFIDKLAKMEDIEAGFNLHVKNIIRNDDQDIYIVLFSDEVSSAEDQEVSQILESNQEMKEEILIEEEIQIPNDSIQLEKDSILTELTVSHVETISEFYVQTAQTLKIFLDFQGKIQRLLEIMVHKASQNPQITSKQLFKIGDFVFAKFMADLNWYRAVIINVQPKTEHSEYEDGPNDGFLYEVYFVDYGNKQEDLPSNLIYSFQSVKSLNLNLNFMSMEDLNYIINLPFQAICCQLIDKKENTRNNEVLKSLLQEYFNFDITVLNTTKAKILNDIEINKYLVKLGTGGTSLDDQFESVEIQQTKKEQVKILRPKFIENILKIDEIYECKLNVLESDIYLNLIEQVELFTKLETELTQASIDLKWSTEPDVNDLVLGKFYLDETNFTWCRALVIKKENFKYDIYFFDYGNVSNDVSIDDLAHLESDYGLDKYPVFAYKTNLFDIQLDLDKHGVILADFLMETFKIKIINIQSPTQDQEINVTKYFIEIWDNEMKQCLNKLLDKNYTIKQKEMAQQHAIDKTNLSELYLNNKTAELKVKVKYIFMDNLIKPFYFCLRNDFEMRKNLDTELNSYYSNNNDSISEFKVNSYLAVYSESSWYRAQIKKLDSNLMTLFYIDYGYDEIVDLNENNLERLRKLAQQFFKYPRFAFGAGLINVLDDKTDSYSLINFDEQDNEFLSDVLKEYFENNSSYFESNLIVLSKLNSSSLNEYFMPNEEYYGIEMYNDKNMCLNEMIAGIKEKKLMKKELRPNGLKLDLTKLPKQSPTNGNYCVFARSLDLFYVYNENKVVDIQKLTQDTCEKILKDQEEFDMSQVDKPDVNNLVYAKYDDDITWYRCLVTNCDENKTKYELFYIDFGNTEIINSSEILTGWTEDQMMPFLNYEAQAYKCKLIGLRPKNTKKEFDNNENNLFKQFITDKVFNVNFIKSDNDTNEVSIEQIASGHGEGMTSSAHVFAIKKDLAEFSNLSEILKSKRTQAENQFYTNLFKIF